jgi:hypothetical protein
MHRNSAHGRDFRSVLCLLELVDYSSPIPDGKPETVDNAGGIA